MPRAELLALLCGLWLACDSPHRENAPPKGDTASALRIDHRVVSQIERALGVSPERAQSLAVEDALLAEQLRREAPGRAQWLERLVLARALSRALSEEAKQSGPPTVAEMDETVAQRWWELDRPRMVQVVHAVVLSEEENPAALALAERIAAAVVQATTAEAFEQAAKAVPAEGLSVKVESLPPVAPDGRAVDPERPPPQGPEVQTLVPEFASAAQRLEAGQLSPVVRTSFGYHVMRALKLIEPRRVAGEELQALIAPEIRQKRALRAQTELLDRQRKELAPQQDRAALTAMALLGANK